eukprot:6194021-Pleurochrysis_carterae.AAC.1
MFCRANSRANSPSTVGTKCDLAQVSSQVPTPPMLERVVSNIKARRARRDAVQGRETRTARTMTTTNKSSSRPLKHQSQTRTLRCGPRKTGNREGIEKPKTEATQTSR